MELNWSEVEGTEVNRTEMSAFVGWKEDLHFNMYK